MRRVFKVRTERRLQCRYTTLFFGQDLSRSLLHAVLYIFTRTKAVLYIVKERESPIRRREGYGDRPKKYRRGMKKNRKKRAKGFGRLVNNAYIQKWRGRRERKKSTQTLVCRACSRNPDISTRIRRRRRKIERRKKKKLTEKISFFFSVLPFFVPIRFECLFQKMLFTPPSLDFRFRSSFQSFIFSFISSSFHTLFTNIPRLCRLFTLSTTN